MNAYWYKYLIDTPCRRSSPSMLIYGSQPNEGLDKLRHRKVCEKVSTSITLVRVQTLPPTSAAAKHHSARVYYQVQEWMRRRALDPQEWGWSLVGDRLDPITMEIPAAPYHLLNVVCCNCKTDCNSRRCTCRKMGLDCSVACGECRGTSCSNSVPLDYEDIDDTVWFLMKKFMIA